MQKTTKEIIDSRLKDISLWREYGYSSYCKDANDKWYPQKEVHERELLFQSYLRQEYGKDKSIEISRGFREFLRDHHDYFKKKKEVDKSKTM